MKKRILTASLTLLMLLVPLLSSCGEARPETPAETQQAVTEAETTTEETELLPALPDDLDMGGETVTFLNCTYVASDAYILAVAEATGDVVQDAVYERNLAVKTRFDCEFDFITKTSGELMTYIQKSVLSGADDFDAVSGIQFRVIQLLADGCFMNMADAPYIDLSMPWWANDYNREMMVSDKGVYFLSGDITLGHLGRLSCIYANKRIWDAINGSTDVLYGTVTDGAWTIEALDKASEAAYSDLNGNGKADLGDQFGCLSDITSRTDHFTYDAGLRCTKRDADGRPVLIFNNERTAAFAEWIHHFLVQSDYVFIDDASDAHLVEIFKSGEALFSLGFFHQAEMLRDMADDYAIIPYPKYDESQDSYLALVHDHSIVFSLPVTCTIFDEISAILEAMAYEGYRTVTPAFFEIALKNKYARDSGEVPIRILDDIRAHSTTDFAYVYNYALNGIALLMRQITRSASPDFASKYAEAEPAAQTKLDELVAVLTEIR